MSETLSYYCPVQPGKWIERTEGLRRHQILMLSQLSERLKPQEGDLFLGSFFDFMETACEKSPWEPLNDWFVFYKQIGEQAIWRTRNNIYHHSPSSLEETDLILRYLTGEMDVVAQMPAEKLERVGGF